jgi:hypothetical protein
MVRHSYRRGVIAGNRLVGDRLNLHHVPPSKTVEQGIEKVLPEKEADAASRPQDRRFLKVGSSPSVVPIYEWRHR